MEVFGNPSTEVCTGNRRAAAAVNFPELAPAAEQQKATADSKVLLVLLTLFSV